MFLIYGFLLLLLVFVLKSKTISDGVKVTYSIFVTLFVVIAVVSEIL